VKTINLATVEVFGLAPALIMADEGCKAAPVVIAGIEGNAGQDCVVKFVGEAAAVRRALEAAKETGERLHAKFTAALRLNYGDPDKVPMVYTPQEFSQITCGYLHILPKDHDAKGPNMQALGILETQGLTGVIEGTDAMLKAANVEIVGKEKIGAAHVTVMVRGDVAAVQAAIAAGKAAAEKVGKVVAAHVIARPHEALAKLLPS